MRFPLLRWPWMPLTLVLLTGLAPMVSAQSRVKVEVVPNTEHAHSITAAVFSPNGSLLLTATGGGGYGFDDYTLRLWDTDTARLVRIFTNIGARALAFSPDGSKLASGGYEVKVWETATGALLHTFKDSSRSVAFSSDGSSILSLSGGRVKVWRFDTAQPTEAAAKDAHAIAISADAKHIIGMDHGRLTVSELETRRSLHTIQTGSAKLSVSDDGQWVLSYRGEALDVFSVATGKLARTVGGVPIGSGFDTKAIAISPDARQVFVPNTRASVLRVGTPAKFVNAESGKISRLFWDPSVISSGVRGLSLSKDGRFLASGDEDATIKLWDLSSGRLQQVVKYPHKHRVMSVAISPDGSQVLSGSEFGGVYLWDSKSGRPLKNLIAGSDGHLSIGFTPDGKRACAHTGPMTRNSSPESVDVWNLATGIPVRKGRLWPTNEFGTVSTDCTRAVSTNQAGTGLKLWDVQRGQLLQALQVDRPDYQIHFAADLILLSTNDIVQSWNPRSQKRLRIFARDEDAGILHATANGRYAVSQQRSEILKIWDVVGGQVLRNLHAESATSIVLSEDGSRLAIGGMPSGRSLTAIRNAANGMLLAQFAVASSGEWIVLTPEGFFSASSPKAAELLSVVRGTELIGIDQAWQSLFNPDLVREKLNSDAEGQVRRAANVLNLEKVLDSGPAPSIVLESDAITGATTSDVVAFHARVTDRGKGVGRVEWRVNGITAAVIAKPTPKGADHLFTRQLALDAGDNIIEVVAYNGSNLLASVPARTTIRFSGPVDGVKPRLHILAIGINAYADRGWSPPGLTETFSFPPLGLAVKDAITFGEAMQRGVAGLYSDVRVTTLLDHQATRDNIAKTMDRLAAEIHPRDTFVLFAAAHGKSENGRFYLIPQDYDGGLDPAMLAKRAVDQDQLQDWLANRIKAKKAVILLDTCESGALVGGHKRSRTDTPSSEAGLGRLHEATGRSILTAAAEGKPAFEGYKGHGVFTWSLLDALRNADRNDNGTIELSELVAHVQDLVPKISATLSGRGLVISAARGSTGNQQAAGFGSKGDDFVLTRRLR